MLGSGLGRSTALRWPPVLLGSNYLPGLAIRVRRAFLNPGDQRPSSGLKPLRVHRSITGILAPFGIAEHEGFPRSEEHTSELQSLMRISYAVFCLKKKKKTATQRSTTDKKATQNKTLSRYKIEN